MKPQDPVLLLKILALRDKGWRSIDLANQLFLSPSEVSESLQRSVRAGLLDSTKKRPFKESLLEFLIHGLKYVFPQRPGALVRGLPTAHSAPPLSSVINAERDIYVWPDEEGIVRGQAIVPLYPSVPKAVREDPTLYEFLSLVDAIRVGKPREQQIAGGELKKRIFWQRE